MKESRRQREQRIFEQTARVGFEHGFVEGAKYAMRLLTGLPRPTAVVVDKNLEPGTVVFHVAPSDEIEAARARTLGDLVKVVSDQELMLAAKNAK